QVRAPVGHGLLAEHPQGLEALVQHPLGLVLESRDVADDVLVHAAARERARVVAVVPAVPVGPDRGDDLLVGARGAGDGVFGRCAHLVPSTEPDTPAGVGFSLLGRVTGMFVVQTCAPPARVTSRWTCEPSRRENVRASASQIWGKRAATCCTGQCPWHSCIISVPGTGRTLAA